jgi:hypothetical protein
MEKISKSELHFFAIKSVLFFSFIFTIPSFAQQIVHDSSTYRKDCLLKYPVRTPLISYGESQIPYLAPFYISKDSGTCAYENLGEYYSLHYLFNPDNFSGKLFVENKYSSFWGNFLIDSIAKSDTIVEQYENPDNPGTFLTRSRVNGRYYRLCPDSLWLFTSNYYNTRDERNYKKGIPDGRWQSFKDTIKVLDGYYKNGNEVGDWRQEFDEGLGSVLYDDTIGISYMELYRGNSDSIKEQNFYYYDTSKTFLYKFPDSEISYNRWKERNVTKLYFPNGKLSCLETYNWPEQFCDSVTSWYNNGVVQRTSYPKKNLYEIRCYYENGKLKSLGYSKECYADLSAEGSIGMYKRWDENGKLVENAAYNKNGEIINQTDFKK